MLETFRQFIAPVIRLAAPAPVVVTFGYRRQLAKQIARLWYDAGTHAFLTLRVAVAPDHPDLALLVFVGKADASVETSVADPAFVGTVGILGDGLTSFRLPVTAALLAHSAVPASGPAGDCPAVKVTLVPIGYPDRLDLTMLLALEFARPDADVNAPVSVYVPWDVATSAR
jgi:hypothetical protein